MIIKSITLKNFRQFRGEHKIDFSTDDDRNVTVVMGENGSGKTTLEQAFIWCLYGRNSFQNKQLINIEVQNAMAITESDRVSVKLCVKFEGKLYLVERTQYLQKRTMISCSVKADVFKVSCQNPNGDWEDIPELQRVSAIENMLPENLSGFFFFDGEHIESMSEELLQKKKSKNFQDAVRALVGLNALQAAMEHFGPDSLKRTVSGKFLNEIQDVRDGRLSEINDRMDELECIIMNCQEKRNKDEASLQDVEKRISDIEAELQSMQTNIKNAEEYEGYKRKIFAEEKQKEKDQDDTLKSFARDSYRILIMPLMKRALEELRTTDKIDKGIPHIHAETINFLLKRGRCICGNDLSSNQNCINRMRDLMQSLPPNNLGTMIGNFVRYIRTEADYANELGTRFIEQGMRYIQHDSNIAEYEAKQDVLKSRLPDKERVASLDSRKKLQVNEKLRLRKSIQQCDEECGGAKREKERLSRERTTILSNDTRNRTNRLYYAYAKAVYESLEQDYKVRVDKTRIELEKVINEIFANIYDSQIGIEINDDYSIKTYLQDKTVGADNLEKNTAQSYAVIFAFIAGIIKMHMEHKEQQSDGLPMVMDAPLSAFDKDRIKRICEALPKIAQQIIIFIKDTDGDIAEEHMSNVIGKKWLIQADSQTSSRIVERG